MSDTTLSDLTNNLGSQSQRNKTNKGLKEKDTNAQNPLKTESNISKSVTQRADTLVQDDLLLS